MSSESNSSQFKTGAVLGPVSRRNFIFGMGTSGLALLCPTSWSQFVIDAAGRSGKRITLLNDGGFQDSAWGWQFTGGARVVDAPGRNQRRAVEVTTESGDYARFLVLGPQEGKTYTFSGWLKTEDVAAQEEGAGAYFAASQFEFQGRPTEYTVDGKQVPEKRYGSFAGSSDWRRFSQSFQCLATTTWFEVVVGIYRASGRAWFSDLTFVEGDQPADFEDVVDFWQAAEWAHQDALRAGVREKPRAAILEEDMPVRGIASDPRAIGRVLGATHTIQFVTASQMADPGYFSRAHFDLLVLPYGETFPLAAWDAVQRFLADGGDLLSTGGYAFRSPVVKKEGKWQFYDEEIKQESGPNLLPDFALHGSGWSASGTSTVSLDAPPAFPTGAVNSVKLDIQKNLWEQSAEWFFDLPAKGEGQQFFFEGWIRTSDVEPAPEGFAYVGVEQLNRSGEPAYAAKPTFEEIRGSNAWHKVERIFYLIPDTRKLRVRAGLKNATGTLWGAGFRLEHRSPQVRINTEFGFPEDSLRVKPTQIGMFDPDFRLKRVSAIQAAAGQCVVSELAKSTGSFEGYAASAVVGMNNARWIPLLEAIDELGRKRGAAGALVYQAHGPYARGSWAFFGVDNQDIFAAESQFGEQVLRAVGRAMVRKCFLHACSSNYATYRDGEAVHLRVLASNYGRRAASLEIRWRILPANGGNSLFEQTQSLQLAAGQTAPVVAAWRPKGFSGDRYRATAMLFEGAQQADRMEIGFNVWKQETLRKGLPFQFIDNYFHVEGKTLFLQGTDDYLHTFIDQDENPLTWYQDVEGCHDSCLDVYENLMGLRGPQHRPTEAWWRWIDAMLLNVQRVGGVFFPGMLIFSNTAVSDKDLADQRAYVQAFAARYKDAAGIMYYLNGDLELHDPNLPDLQKLYNEYLAAKYGSNEALRKAWILSPPEAPIGKLTIHRGGSDWRDVRTLDDFRFRAQVVRRWLDAMHSSIREVDSQHPVTAEFYQTPVSGIDLLTALGKLELANFGYFNEKNDDYYRFPQTCKFLDQSLLGKGINVGEFGVKTHPAWRDTGYYIEARTEAYEQAYFLAIAHYGFALGASKIQNWCWKYPDDLPFEWGINYSNELIPRDVRFFYRNAGLLFRHQRPRYERSDIVFLIAGDNRMGGQGRRIIEGQLNGIRLLLDQRLRFATLADDSIESLTSDVKTIFYPLPYCPSDKIVRRLDDFVRRGGQLYISGDISYDSLRQRTQVDRLKKLCGVEFISERFLNIEYQHGAMLPLPNAPGWPQYNAAPGIVTRPVGAKVLLAGGDGTPVVTEFERGGGRVIFSTDPIELHGDPRYHNYGQLFYRQLLKAFGLTGEPLEPADAPVHCFRVPSQDERQIVVLVNYDQAKPANNLTVTVADRNVRLSLGPRMSGVVVAEHDSGIQAVESSGDVFDGNQLLTASDLHFMAISFLRQSLLTSRRLLLLPMAQGELQIPNARRWLQPVVLAGEVAASRWRQDERFHPAEIDGKLRIPIGPAQSLSMLILCEAGEQAEAIQQMEEWVNAPWKLDGQA